MEKRSCSRGRRQAKHREEPLGERDPFYAKFRFTHKSGVGYREAAAEDFDVEGCFKPFPGPFASDQCGSLSLFAIITRAAAIARSTRDMFSKSIFCHSSDGLW